MKSVLTRRLFLKHALILPAAAASIRVASAHARLVRSEPKNGARLERAPATIELWFNETLDEMNTAAIYAADAQPPKNLASGKPRVDPKDKTRLVIPAPPLAPGDYRVEFRVLSRDGHIAPGRIGFTILPPAQP